MGKEIDKCMDKDFYHTNRIWGIELTRAGCKEKVVSLHFSCSCIIR